MANENEWLKQMRAREEELERIDKEAKDNGTLVGRYITEGFADGYAVYRITKEFNNQVQIEVVSDIGDGWVIPYWGEKTKIKKDYALQSIRARDNPIFGSESPFKVEE